MTLLSRDRGLLDKVLLRSVIHPLSLSETRSIVETRLATNGHACSESAWVVVHQITGGILEDVFRLVGMAQVVAGSQPDTTIQADDIEQIYERLHAAAA
jgi:DNA helicase TIP49 (TBP-interacting protein)